MATVHAAPEHRTSAPPVQRRADLRVHQLDDEGLVYDRCSSDTHHLNATAMFIWLRCDGLHTICAMAEALAAHFEVSVSAASEHVDRTLKEFRKRRLLLDDDDAPELNG